MIEKDAFERQRADAALREQAFAFMRDGAENRYSYHFTWLGRPIIQFPQDIIALQEIIWTVRPDLIVETGIAHGGSLVFHASMLELLGGDRVAVGIDLDIRPHNRAAIEEHPMAGRIRLLEGSSTDPTIAGQVAEMAKRRHSVLLVLDSNHTHDHVLEELRLYTPLVTPGSYAVVFDTLVERFPASFFPGRDWGTGNSPATAIAEFLRSSDRFEVDTDIDAKLLISVAPGGYLKCLK